MNIEIETFRSDIDPKRWEWMWLTELPDNFVVRSAFTYTTKKSAQAAGKRSVKNLIAECARLQSGERHAHSEG